MIQEIMRRKDWLLSLFIINLGGFIFGMYYYFHQLSSTSPLLWLFVMDCPLYVLLFAFVCLMLYRDRPLPNWFLLLVAVGTIKYGFWTILTIGLYLDHLLAVSFLVNAAMPFLHAGMILEAVVLIPHIRPKAWHMLPVLGWLLLNDWSDYFWGTVPLLPQTHMQLLMWESFLATLILTPLIYLIGRRKIWQSIK